MSVWRNKVNRTILISSIILVLFLAIIIIIAVWPFEDEPIAGLNWLYNKPWGWVTIMGILFWGFYFGLILLVGSVREKMNALPGWTEVVICALVTLLPAIFLGYLANFDTSLVEDSLPLLKWMTFIIALVGVILITLWVLMSSTATEEVDTTTSY